MSSAQKDSKNPFYNSKYADLNSIWTACKECLSSNGLAVSQVMAPLDGELYLITTLGHSSGQWMRSFLPLKFDPDAKDGKSNPLQKLGSSISYLRRYSLAAMVGVTADEDDDGNAGGVSYRTPEKKAEPLINKQQVDALLELLDQDPEFKEKVIKNLRDKKISEISMLPVSLYQIILKTTQEHISKKKEEEVTE